MTTYASPLAESQAKLAAARNAASQARIALNQTTAARLVADSAYPPTTKARTKTRWLPQPRPNPDPDPPTTTTRLAGQKYMRHVN